MLVGTHDGGIDHRVFVVGVPGQMIEDHLPHTALGLAGKPSMHDAEVAKPLRQIAPGNARTVAVKNRLDEQTVVRRRPANGTLSPRQKPLNPLPLIIPQPITPGTHALKLKKARTHAYSEFDDRP